MARVRVDTDSLGSVARTIDDCVAQTAELMSKMRTSVHELDKTWVGDNHDTFMKEYDQNKDAIKLHGLAMEKFSDSMNQAVKLYQKLEEEIASVVAKV